MNPVVAQQIRSAVEARMRELQPVVAELEQLRGVLAMLDEPGEERQPSISTILRSIERTERPGNVTPIRRAERLGSKRGIDGRAPQGANKQQILAVIAKHPGIAAPQIAQLTGLKRPLVASTVSRLKRTGELQAHGDGVCLGGSEQQLGPAQTSSL
jgi:Winged helix-turn-helix DNA-binding